MSHLHGHTDWIRDLRFSNPFAVDGCPTLLLASASQDNYARLWRISQQFSKQSQDVDSDDHSLSGESSSLEDEDNAVITKSTLTTRPYHFHVQDTNEKYHLYFFES